MRDLCDEFQAAVLISVPLGAWPDRHRRHHSLVWDRAGIFGLPRARLPTRRPACAGPPLSSAS